MKNIIYSLLCTIVLLSCGSKDVNSSYDYEFTGEEILNGDYCAEIDYYNPETGTSSTYTLPIEVEDGYLTKIQWSNGGWLDDSHFTEPEFDGDETSFTDDRGREYTVRIIGQGGCGYSSYITPEEDDDETIRKKEEEETCPVCYGFKSSYDEICLICQSNREEERVQIQEEEEY